MDYKFAVIAELREDLDEEVRKNAENRLDYLRTKLRLIQLETGEFVTCAPIEEYGDLGSVYLFYCGLADHKHWFSKLVYHNYYDDVTCQAV